MDETPIGRAVHWLARGAAIAGGVVRVLVTAVTIISIIGRALIPLNAVFGTGFRPILGDYEIVEAGMAFAIFAFLPWCQLTRGNAIVAVVTDMLPVRYTAVTEFIMELLTLIVAVFITWRHFVGMLDKYGYMETSFVLRFPLWWAYALGMFGAVIWVIVTAYCTVRAAANATSKTPAMPEAEMAE
jgi:TRAP-type C4-dicarboxylate transport system permease small subunit